MHGSKTGATLCHAQLELPGSAIQSKGWLSVAIVGSSLNCLEI